MSADIVIQEDPKSDMTMRNCSDQEEKMNLGLCKSAGVETPNDSDQNRFQRRHFPNRMSSNIFFSELSSEDDASSENNIDHKDLFPSAGTETRKTDQKLSERRHFILASEDSKQSEESANQDDQVDSNETSESTEIEMDDANDDELKTQRRHFHDKTSSNIFFCGLPQEDTALKNRVDPYDYRKRKG